eukprot:COSAG01_NODE_6575_length_3601_cov_2.426328_3_plen_245_part_00
MLQHRSYSSYGSGRTQPAICQQAQASQAAAASQQQQPQPPPHTKAHKHPWSMYTIRYGKPPSQQHGAGGTRKLSCKDVFVVTKPFNGSVLRHPAWRKDEDLSLNVGDIVLCVGPAPYCGTDDSQADAEAFKSWAVGRKLSDPDRCAIFPYDSVKRATAPGSTCADLERLLGAADRQALQSLQQRPDHAAAGYAAVPRVPVETVEVSSASLQRPLPGSSNVPPVSAGPPPPPPPPLLRVKSRVLW